MARVAMYSGDELADGCRVMYAGCPDYTDDIGRGCLTPDRERELLEKLPPFDPLTARSSREHGILVEFLRTYPGSVVTEHVLLGCDHDAATFLHYAEHIVDIPDKRVARFKVPVNESGARVWRDMEEFDSSSAGAHAHWPDRFFARIVDTHLRRSNNSGGPVGDAHTFPIDASGLLQFALPVMRAVAHDAAAADRQLDR